MSGLSSIKFSTFFEYSPYDRTRGHSLKLVKKRARLDLRQHFSVNEPVTLKQRHSLNFLKKFKVILQLLLLYVTDIIMTLLRVFTVFQYYL